MSRTASPRARSATRARAERRAASSQIGWPDGREGRVGQGEPQRLADHLGRCRGAEELAAAAGRAARATPHVGSALERDLAVGEPGADGLHGARVLGVPRRQGHAARHQDAGQVPHRRERHHHRRQALVAGGYPEDAPARRERADQAAEHLRRVVPVGQAVHHPDRALRAAVARVGDEAGERQALEAAQLPGRRLHEEAHLPVSGVVAEGDRLTVGRADPALGREDQELRAAELPRVPPHAGVLGPAEHVAARTLEQHLRCEGKPSRGTLAHRADLEQSGRAPDDLVEPDGRLLPLPCAHLGSFGVRP